MAVHWYWIVGWFFTLFGLVGNTWVIFFIVKRRRLQTTANWFIFSLAVADLSVICGYFPPSMVCKILVKTCNSKIRYNFLNFFMEASMFAVIAVIAERYIAIVYSLRYVQVMTTKRTAILMAASWGIPAILSVFRLIYDLYESKLSAGEERTIFIIYTVLLEVAPIVLLIAATLHILLIARKLSLQMKALLTQVRFNVAANSASVVKVPKMGFKASTVRLVTALVVIFVTCYGTEIYITICAMFELCVVSVGEQTAFSLLLMANSVFNPLVYAFLKEDIKRETKALFFPRRRIYRSTMRFSQRC